MSESADKPNVLMIVADDLRPELGCFGCERVHTPHIDRLAESGLVFERAYCQLPLCNPSRASALTGLRPDTTRIFDNSTHFRVHHPEIVTLPQHLRAHGYHTQAVGKVFHSCFHEAYVGERLDDPRSWGVPSWFGPPRYYHTPEGIDVARRIFARRPRCGRETGGLCIHSRLQGESEGEPASADEWMDHFVQGLICEAPDVDDTELHDGVVADHAVQALESLRERTFFLAVGFMKPHTPYVAPRRYWDLYRRERIELPANSSPPHGCSPMALPPDQDHDPYTGVTVDAPLTEEEARHLIHGHLACVSFVDAQIGKVLSALGRLGLSSETIVILWSDHGYHLGENGRWGKQTCLELSNRVPLIVAAPGMRVTGKGTRALVELVDVYPTVCNLTGVPLPSHLEGTGFTPILDDPSREWKTAAFSQFPRPVRGSHPDVEPEPGDVMGHTMRTERHRYTQWREVLNPIAVVAEDLFDLAADPEETENQAGNPDMAELLGKLRAQMQLGWRGAQPVGAEYGNDR